MPPSNPSRVTQQTAHTSSLRALTCPATNPAIVSFTSPHVSCNKQVTCLLGRRPLLNKTAKLLLLYDHYMYSASAIPATLVTREWGGAHQGPYLLWKMQDCNITRQTEARWTCRAWIHVQHAIIPFLAEHVGVTENNHVGLTLLRQKPRDQPLNWLQIL